MEKNIPGILHGNNYPLCCPLCQANININTSNNIHCLTGPSLSDNLERNYLRFLYAEYEINDRLTILDTSSGNNVLFSNILLCMRWDQRQHQAMWLEVSNEKLPLKNGTVDVILSTLTTSCFHEFIRVLKPGGLVIKTILLTEYSSEMEVLISNTGFSIERIMEIAGSHTILCLRKGW